MMKIHLNIVTKIKQVILKAVAVITTHGTIKTAVIFRCHIVSDAMGKLYNDQCSYYKKSFKEGEHFIPAETIKIKGHNL